MPKHYLLSLLIPKHRVDLHCYVMTNNQADLKAVSAKMVELAEDNFGKIRLEVILVTPLEPSDVKAVRDVLLTRTEADEQIRKLLKEATDFHMTVWPMSSIDPDSARLMKLH